MARPLGELRPENLHDRGREQRACEQPRGREPEREERHDEGGEQRLEDEGRRRQRTPHLRPTGVTVEGAAGAGVSRGLRP